jgi:hypothetical protein
MAITYPRAFPSIARFAQTPAFTLLEGLAVNRTGGGEIEAMELADPVWTAKYQTVAVAEANRAAWTAWRASLRGGRTFLGWDPGRPWPLAYGAPVLNLTRAGGGAFDGTAKVTAATAQGFTLATLPANYQVSVGDRVSLVRPNSQRSLHEVLEAAPANGSGVVTVTVEPTVPADVVINSTAVQLVRPTCVFVLLSDTFQAPTGLLPQPVSFDAVQDTKPQS